MWIVHPPVYAIACALLWLALLLVHAAAFFLPMAAHAPLSPGWHFLELACIIALGALVLLPLPRALQWRLRRHPRPSPELQKERKRIARDLHDQVGSQLVNAMALLDADDAAQRPARQALEQCMLDVRCLVDSMDGYDDSLADSLARLRHRVQPVLERRNIRLAWSVQWAQSIPTGARARELANVAREAISNVLQHAQASELTVSLALVDGVAGREWMLSVSDDGQGLPQDRAVPEGMGMGMASMRERVRSVGGALHITRAAQGGLHLRITVPAACQGREPLHASGGKGGPAERLGRQVAQVAPRGNP